MRTITLTLLAFSVLAYGQEKKKIDHTVYDSWNTLSDVKQSPSGNLIAYDISPAEGDGSLFIAYPDSAWTRSFSRGKNIQIHHQEAFVVFSIKAEFDTIRTLKLDKVKADKHPKDSLAIYQPQSDSLQIIPNVKSFKISKKGDWIAYLSENDERYICPKKKKRHQKRHKCVNSKTSGTTLHLINPITSATVDIDCVVSYQLSEYGDKLIYITSHKGDKDSLDITCLDMDSTEMTVLLEKQLKISKVKFDKPNEQLVFLHSSDTNKRKVFALSYWKPGMIQSEILIDSTTAGMPENSTISEYSNPYFSQNGEKLFVGTNLIIIQDPEDTLLATEKAKVDVWSGFDLKIQPQQLKEKKRMEKQSYAAVYHLKAKTLVQIENDSLGRLRTIDNGNGENALIYNANPYQKSANWDYPWKSDVYVTNLTTGALTKIKTAQGHSGRLSPSGDYYIWFEGIDSNWMSKAVTNPNDSTNLTQHLDAIFSSDNNGNTYVSYSEGSSGWTLIEDEAYYIVNDKFDIWALCPSKPAKTFCVTNGDGAKKEMTYRLNRFDPDSTYLNLETALIHGVNFATKAESYWKLKLGDEQHKLTKLIESNHKFTFLAKAEKSDRILFRRMNFIDYPDLEVSNFNFDAPKKISETNPQQGEFNWGTVEMIAWTSFEGKPLRGLLYKPADFDSTKSYPMIAYFYEKYTANIHFHYVPKPTASIVYPTEYVSNGYLIFIPDILYNPGHPAASAYDCIVSGTDYLTQHFSWVDSTRLGLQGQSWGGYQTAQLITMTTKYKAAMAGAPVSNMFSAYGGIRWGSGLSRMFQYEKTQSRIGYTIWEKPELYIENSPIFGLDHVKTPLLIMHNDGDGSVPWYQGIELYMGLRRLDQPVWLLNYNGDEHNLMKTANRKDLSIRMRQFFDYYLLDAEIPVWMSDGIPALDKGKDYGFKLKKN